ncbi:hypothetical protein B0H34DRAFT_737779 [Crassisporium funariophilum]|nr:hypothetical protein B0H34DRAFT_737779 [Crassisporium funariophilum]
MTDSVLPLSLLLGIDTPPLSGALGHRRSIEVTYTMKTGMNFQTPNTAKRLCFTQHPIRQKFAHNSTGTSSNTSDAWKPVDIIEIGG